MPPETCRVDLQRNKTSPHIVTSVGYSIEYYDARNNKYKVFWLFVCSCVCLTVVEASLVTSKEAGQEVSALQVKYVPVCREQNAGQDRKMKTGNISFEKLAKFKYF